MQKKPARKPHHPQYQLAHQVRIIGGQWKRTALPVLAAEGLRPTPDRVRETVFNWINHLRDGEWATARCLDLFAGTGALGFEAASRGAHTVTMIDAHSPVVAQLQAVKDKLKAEQVEIVRGDAVASAQSMAARGQQFDLIFLDPPYQQGWLDRVMPICERLLAPGGLLYAESGSAFAPDLLPGSKPARTHSQAETVSDSPPAWLAEWDIIRADKAGIVFYHLLQRK